MLVCKLWTVPLACFRDLKRPSTCNWGDSNRSFRGPLQPKGPLSLGDTVMLRPSAKSGRSWSTCDMSAITLAGLNSVIPTLGTSGRRAQRKARARSKERCEVSPLSNGRPSQSDVKNGKPYRAKSDIRVHTSAKTPPDLDIASSLLARKPSTPKFGTLVSRVDAEERKNRRARADCGSRGCRSIGCEGYVATLPTSSPSRNTTQKRSVSISCSIGA
mmetsp:Transcript_21646/g.57470  ORF Transcript_21646/g.57470 Transcript_21646/m.57470 type:complete len:216 (+) Transcript_21646:2908-3555(+)